MDRVAIEQEIGAELDWRELPNQAVSQVVLRRTGVDPNDRADWPEQHAWLQDKLEAFHRAFSPRVKNLEAASYESPPQAPT